MLHTGVDLIEIERVAGAIERYGDRFLARVFTAAERAACAGRVPSLAARFAAKEAVAKLLGVGLRGIGAGERAAEAVAFHQIEILRDQAGRPVVILHGRAADRAASLGLGPIALSLSHTRLHAIASAVASAAASPYS